MKPLLAAAALLGATLPNLPAHAAPVVDIPSADAVFLQEQGTGDLVFEGAAIVEEAEAEGDLSAFFALSFDLADPYGTAEATLDLFDDAGLFLGGIASFVDFAEDQLFLTFSGLDGSAAALFGQTLSFELFFVDPVGVDPLAGLVDGATYDVAGFGVGSETPAPVPLPATGSLLLAALGAAAGLGLKRRARAVSNTVLVPRSV